MDEVLDVDLAAELGELRRLVTAQSARIAELEAHVAPQLPLEERSTRRGMLRLAGAAVVGGAAAALVSAEPAAALGSVILGTSNDGTTLITTVTSSSSFYSFQGSNSSSGDGLKGSGTSNGRGVHGFVSTPTANGIAVYAENFGTLGYGVFAQGGQAQLMLFPLSGTVAPSSGFHSQGEVVANSGGFWGCVAPGAPGTWRKIVGSATAGAFHAITPTRVYDSRAVAPSPGLLPAGASRTISVADGRDSNGTVTAANLVPTDATAVAANITVTGTTGEGGYLSVNPGGNTSATSSTINWFGAGQNIANGVTLTLDVSRQLTVVCGVAGGGTHFIVDISGYYL